MESSFTGLLVLAPPTKYRLNSSSVQTFIWELSLLKNAPPFVRTLLYNSCKLQPGFHGPNIHNCIVMGFHCIKILEIHNKTIYLYLFCHLRQKE